MCYSETESGIGVVYFTKPPRTVMVFFNTVSLYFKPIYKLYEGLFDGVFTFVLYLY